MGLTKLTDLEIFYNLLDCDDTATLDYIATLKERMGALSDDCG